MTDDTETVLQLARYAAAGDTSTGRLALAMDYNPDTLLRALIQTYETAFAACLTPEGQIAARINLAQLAERHGECWEFHLAVRVILRAQQAADAVGDEILYQVGATHLEDVSAYLDAHGWAADVLAAIPAVYGRLMPLLHTETGLELLARYATEATTP